MNTCMFVLFCLFSGLVVRGQFSWEQFTWDTLYAIRKQQNTSAFAYHQPGEGELHMFWEKSTDAGKVLVYQVLTFRNVVEVRKEIRAKNRNERFLQIDAKVSSDQKHVAVVYTTRQPSNYCGYSPFNFCSQVFFIESRDGGKNWSEPISVSGNGLERYNRLNASIAMDHLGRIYIAYQISSKPNANSFSYIGLAFRDVHTSVFKTSVVPSTPPVMHTLSLALTTERGSWVHLFVQANGDLLYSRSANNGEEWSKFRIIEDGLEGHRIQTLATSLYLWESGLFLQVNDNEKGLLVWSKNHGATFEASLRMPYKVDHDSKLSVCSSSRVVLSSHYNSEGLPTISILHKKNAFEKKQSPFSIVMEKNLKTLALSCRVGKGKSYVISFIAGSHTSHRAYTAHGTFNN